MQKSKILLVILIIVGLCGCATCKKARKPGRSIEKGKALKECGYFETIAGLTLGGLSAYILLNPPIDYEYYDFQTGETIVKEEPTWFFWITLPMGVLYTIFGIDDIIKGNNMIRELSRPEYIVKPTYQPPVSQPVVTSPPELIFDYFIKDKNNNKILDGGEKVSIKVIVFNQGEGTAQGVKVLLSGRSKALNYLGREKYLGDIQPNVQKKAVFEAILPYQIEPGEGNIVIKVTESRGFGALQVKELRVAMQPARVKHEMEVVSTLIDVDQPLTPSSFRRKDAYGVIIGITDYRSTKIPKVKYAKRDAETMKEYLVNVCGVPDENIMTLYNDRATLSDLTAYIEEWLARNVSRNSFVFIYFAGHGTPNPEKGDAYLVPYDGEPGFVSKLYPLARFYNSLEKLPTNQIVVALDACFSGAGGRSVIEEGKRPLSVVKMPKTTKKTAVITASAGDEISQDLDTKRHGLFTYYFLKGLRGEADANGDNWITLGELYNYCKPRITKESRRLGYTQTPQILPKPLGKKANLKIGKVK